MDTMMNLTNSAIAIDGVRCMTAITAALLTLSTVAMIALACLYAGAGILKRVR